MTDVDAIRLWTGTRDRRRRRCRLGGIAYGRNVRCKSVMPRRGDRTSSGTNCTSSISIVKDR